MKWRKGRKGRGGDLSTKLIPTGDDLVPRENHASGVDDVVGTIDAAGLSLFGVPLGTRPGRNKLVDGDDRRIVLAGEQLATRNGEKCKWIHCTGLLDLMSGTVGCVRSGSADIISQCAEMKNTGNFSSDEKNFECESDKRHEQSELFESNVTIRGGAK